GKSGEGVTLIAGVLAQAKAFQILHEVEIEKEKSQKLMQLVWNYLKDLAEAEMANMELKRRIDVSSEEKLQVMEMQAESLKVLSNIGGLLGDGSEDELKHLGNYIKYLSMILDLIKDFKISINLTFELAEKINRKSLTYTLLWAKNYSQNLREYLLKVNERTEKEEVKKIVKMMLQTRVVENITNLISSLVMKAEEEISLLNNNKTVKILRFLLNSQQTIFNETLKRLVH
ncbi:MAG: hypothetical protein ACTSYB_17950, partial [Candidatus Helarchaeota archaeon]